MDIYLGAVIILGVLAISDLNVGVSNDAVNFLNSSIGSKVAPRYIVMIIASIGMLMGVTFSKGMMEVARKGIFHPKLFTMPEMIVICLAVMITDVLLLDLYNTFGLPTSTTVSIVFELLGAAVALSFIKVTTSGEPVTSLVRYINTAKALAIISGILLSVGVAFFCGMVIQFLTRLLFTFDYHKRLRRHGAFWGGAALSIITYFILVKGAEGSVLITPETKAWIQHNTIGVLLFSFVVCALILQAVLLLTRINILKPIILMGTFALAMAFAANDLVNFIGVPLAGMNAYKVAQASPDPSNTMMTALQTATPSDTILLILSGFIMVFALWTSRKSRTVSATELGLVRQAEGAERFGSSPLSRTVVRMAAALGQGMKAVIPNHVIHKMNGRFNNETAHKEIFEADNPSFDLVRAAVNLVVASALISFGTSLKLPLSTTYVTFMVSMGSSFSDRAWDRDTAVYRITGVFTVIGGWFLTAFMAFTVAAVFAVVIFYTRVPGVIALMALAVCLIIHSNRLHKKREKEVNNADIFHLKKVKDSKYAISTTYEHVGHYFHEVAAVLDSVYHGLEKNNRTLLKNAKRESKKVRNWTNILVANIFKTLRLMQKEDPVYTQKYAEAVSILQEIGECQRDAVRRAYEHVDNNHKPLLRVQLEELVQVKDLVVGLLEKIALSMKEKKLLDLRLIEKEIKNLKKLRSDFDHKQVRRIQEQASKTRLSILYYGFIRDFNLILVQVHILMKIFHDSFTLQNSNHQPTPVSSPGHE